MFNVSPESAVKYTKFMVFLMFTWPPSPEASRLTKNLFNIFSWIFISLPLLLVIFLVNAAFYHLQDHFTLTKIICLAVTCLQAVIKMLICKVQRSRFQMLHRQFEDFINNATPREREMLQFYVNRCAYVHFCVNVCAFMASLAMICGPLVLPQDLPTDAKYPFSVKNYTAWILAYLHQAIVGLQCASIHCIECQAALLIWFAGARFELLANEFENSTSLCQFKNCIKKHQFLLENTKEVIRATRFIILSSTFTNIISIITGSINIVSNQQSLIVKCQFLIIDCGFLCVFFLTAWPADNLINTCHAIGQGAYNCRWIRGSSEIREHVSFVVQRSQIPSIITVPGILPRFSLKYYATFLSAACSYFTTLRIIIDKVNDPM